MDPNQQDRLQDLLQELLDRASDYEIAPDDLEKWLKAEVDYQLGNYRDEWGE